MARVNPTTPAGKTEETKPAEAPKTEAPVVATPVAAGDEKKAKPARDRSNLLIHPALKPDADGKPTVKLDHFPADYKTTVHKLLTPANFTSEKAFLIGKAERLEAEAQKLRAQAESTSKFGPKAGQFAKILSRLDEVKAEMVAGGVDVEALIAALRAKKDEGKKDEKSAA